MRSILNFRRLQSALVLATWAVASLSCTSESASDDKESEACETGTERCECYRNDSCDDGLMCLSDVCVKSTGADDDQDAGGDAPNKDNTQGADDSEDAAPADEPSSEAPAQHELQDGSVGAACGECDAELVCIPDVPNGYCSAQCAGNADCGADGACVANVCYRVCDADADCRPRYACVNTGDVSVCDVGESTATGSDTEPGSCANTCAHYLACKDIFDSETQQTCESNCASSGYSSDDLAAFQTSDCETAIYMVEGPASSEGGSGSGGGGVDCDGCQWDGSSCVYISQYTLVSTGGITCDASCCN